MWKHGGAAHTTRCPADFLWLLTHANAVARTRHAAVRRLLTAVSLEHQATGPTIPSAVPAPQFLARSIRPAYPFFFLHRAIPFTVMWDGVASS